MLAQLEAQLPTGDVWQYEPKLDGFRGLLWNRAGGIVQLLSRNGRDLGPWFPELVQAGQTLSPCTLIDGEIVIADQDGYADFSAMQTRLTEARAHVSRIARERAAVLVVFDVLDVASRGLMDEPLLSRRPELERLLADAAHPSVRPTAPTRLRPRPCLVGGGNVALWTRTMTRSCRLLARKTASAKWRPGPRWRLRCPAARYRRWRLCRQLPAR